MWRKFPCVQCLFQVKVVCALAQGGKYPILWGDVGDSETRNNLNMEQICFKKQGGKILAEQIWYSFHFIFCVSLTPKLVTLSFAQPSLSSISTSASAGTTGALSASHRKLSSSLRSLASSRPGSAECLGVSSRCR